MKMRKLTFLFLASLMIIASGCVELPSKKAIYKDSDVEVIRHEPLVIMADGGPSSFELIALGHTYELSDCIDYFCDDCKGFARTPDGSTIVFIAQSQQKPQAGMMTGVVYVIDFKSKSEKEVPLAIKFNGERYRMFVKSYDGKKIVLSMNLNFYSTTLEIDLDTKQVTEVDHTNSSILK
ncbi:MAG TPA: hypothetical protein VHG89_07030 [Verrucomicrobiae bacterium]|nr:hypothetical protein [Verrucomicrobiae bacterium]